MKKADHPSINLICKESPFRGRGLWRLEFFRLGFDLSLYIEFRMAVEQLFA